MKEKFEYNEAIAELEKIAARVEDPATGLDEIERCIKRSDELIAGSFGTQFDPALAGAYRAAKDKLEAYYEAVDGPSAG